MLRDGYKSRENITVITVRLRVIVSPTVTGCDDDKYNAPESPP